MKKTFLMAGIMAVCAWCSAAENLILNADFSEKSPVGLPMHWVFGGNSGSRLKSENGIAVISPKLSSVQRNIKIESNKSYLLSYEAKGSPDAVFQLYSSWQEGDTKHHRYTDASKKKCTAEFQDYQFIFTTGEKARSYQLYLNALTGKELQLRKLELKEIPLQGKIRNADFSLISSVGPVNWVQRNKAEFYRYENGTAILEGKDSATLLVQNTEFKPGDQYVLSFEVRGTGNYRTYLGWIQIYPNKKRDWKSSGSSIKKLPEKWTKQSFRISIPKGDFSVTSNLVLQAEKNSKAEWRNITIVPFEAKKLLGGTWQLNGNSDFEKDQLVIRSGSAVLEDVPVKPGQHYRLDFRIFGVGTAKNPTGFHIYRVSAIIGKKVIEAPWDDTIGDQYQLKKFNFTVPDGCKTVNLRFQGQQGSFSRIDRIKLEACEPEVPQSQLLIVHEPFYRNSFYSSRPEEKHVRGEVVFPKGVTSAEVRFNGKVKKLTAAGKFSFDASGLKVGKYPLTVKFSNGRTVTQEIRKLAKAKVEVVLAPDLFFYVNGKRVMPNTIPRSGAYSFKGGAYQGARNGVNVTFSIGGHGSGMQMLDAAEKMGLKIIFHCGVLHQVSKAEKQSFLHNKYNAFPPEMRNHPAFFGYFMVDEPAWAGMPLKCLEETYRLMREFDPYHPVWINEAPRGGLETHRQVAGACDAYGVDIYPVPAPSMHSGLDDKMMTSVGKYAELCREAGYDRKAVWLYLQGWSWKTQHNPDAQDGYPTPEELHFMQMDAWIHGCTGTFWWGTSHVRSEKFYNENMDAVRHLHRLSGMLALPRTPYKVPAPLFAVQYRSGKNQYVVVENPTDKKASVELPAGLKKLDGPDAGELPPWSVTVYGNAPLPKPAYELPEKNAELESVPNPFRQSLVESGKPYLGKASWIWAKGLLNSQRDVIAQGKINITRPVKSAVVFYTVDDVGELKFNGTALAPTRGWNTITEAPVKLKQGENTVWIRAHNVMGACGILFELRVVYQDGTRENFVSGGPWLLAGPEGGKLQEAEVIAPFGEGAWKKKPKIR